jgi:hypothetical protein
MVAMKGDPSRPEGSFTRKSNFIHDSPALLNKPQVFEIEKGFSEKIEGMYLGPTGEEHVLLF